MARCALVCCGPFEAANVKDCGQVPKKLILCNWQDLARCELSNSLTLCIGAAVYKEATMSTEKNLLVISKIVRGHITTAAAASSI